MFEIFNTLLEDDISEDYVALGNLIEKGNDPYHASIIIRYNSIIYVYHYTGSSIEFNKLEHEEYFHKRTETIHKSEIPALIAYCNIIKKRANPIYGYFYSGEYYDQNGKHFSQNKIGERMTCVGFCLNVLTGFLEKNYLNYTDWDSTSHSNTDYLSNYAKKHNLDINRIKQSHRRISPIEFLTSGFFKITPITKLNIDSKIDSVRIYFQFYSFKN